MGKTTNPFLSKTSMWAVAELHVITMAGMHVQFRLRYSAGSVVHVQYVGTVLA